MWNDAYLVGVEQIDQQHKQLIGVLDDLLKCTHCGEDYSKPQCKQTMAFVKDYVVTHFTTEEMLLEKIGYPLLAEHRVMHDKFKTSVHELDLELMRADYSYEKTREVISLLTKWWIYHINKEDKKMVPYLKQSSVTATSTLAE